MVAPLEEQFKGGFERKIQEQFMTIGASANPPCLTYAALAVFFGLFTGFDWGLGAAFLFAAHRWRIRSAAAALCAAVNLRRCFFAG